MDLEAIEQRCLAYLCEASSPLVPLGKLHRHIEEDAKCGDVSSEALADFLRNHPLVRVVEGYGHGNTAPLEDDAGPPRGPAAILESRVPTREEMAAIIEENMAAITGALSSALAEAERTGDSCMYDKVLDALARTEKLHKKTRESFEL